ncbi:MAG: hypothetical protein M5U28_41205 [Sandaracinaceae bacterium]|nr:hypothetical protein [Sandaracinaceae bacterium]
MRRRGYGAEVGLARELVLEEHGVAIPLDLRAGECTTFVALGGGSIRELALTLYDGEGREAAADSVAGEGALVHVCPQPAAVEESPEAELFRPFHLVIRAREGAGAVLVAQFRSPPGEGDGFDGIFEGILAPRVPFRELEGHLARSRSALRARGFSPLGPPLLDRVTEGAVVRLPVELEGGRCYVAIGRSDGAQDIDLFLFDGAGVEVDRDLGGDAEPSIEHCPAEGGRHTVELRAFEGAGAVGVLVLVGPGLPSDPVDRIEEPRPAVGGDPSLAIEVLGAPLRDRGFGAPLFVSRDAAILPGEVRTHDVVIGPGCSVVIGAASHEGMDLDLYLADEAGREVDRDTAVHSTARVRACRPAPSVLRVAVKAYGRDGAYALAVLRAPPGRGHAPRPPARGGERALRAPRLRGEAELRGRDPRGPAAAQAAPPRGRGVRGRDRRGRRGRRRSRPLPPRRGRPAPDERLGAGPARGGRALRRGAGAAHAGGRDVRRHGARRGARAEPVGAAATGASRSGAGARAGAPSARGRGGERSRRAKSRRARSPGPSRSRSRSASPAPNRIEPQRHRGTEGNMKENTL